MRPIHALKSLLLAIAIALPALAMASETQPYSPDAFAKAKEEGKSIVLDFKASWCGTCKVQGEALEALLKEDRFNDVVAFTVDYDKESALKKEFKVISQSTLVMLKGEKELERAIGITDPKKIADLLSTSS